LLISEAVARLEKGMFGGPISRPEPVRKLKEEAPRFSVGFGPQRERAAAVILSAMLEGDLLVHVLTRPTGEGARRSIVVPVDVLQRMPTARDGLPDHPVRHPVAFLRNYPVAEDLFAALSTSALHVKRTEFEAWYKKQKGLRLGLRKGRVTNRAPVDLRSKRNRYLTGSGRSWQRRNGLHPMASPGWKSCSPLKARRRATLLAAQSINFLSKLGIQAIASASARGGPLGVRTLSAKLFRPGIS
jgi:hypothetical protein